MPSDASFPDITVPILTIERDFLPSSPEERGGMIGIIIAPDSPPSSVRHFPPGSVRCLPGEAQMHQCGTIRQRPKRRHAASPFRNAACRTRRPPSRRTSWISRLHLWKQFNGLAVRVAVFVDGEHEFSSLEPGLFDIDTVGTRAELIEHGLAVGARQLFLTQGAVFP